MLAELGNIYVYSNLPAQAQQTKTSDTLDLLKNLQNEIIFIDSISNNNEAMFSDFIWFMGNFSGQKNYDVSYSNSSGQ